MRGGLPLGLVGALQELGSVAGPLYGAAIVSVASWRAIFWINVPVTVVLGGGFWLTRASAAPSAAPSAAGPRASPALARSAWRRNRLSSPPPAPALAAPTRPDLIGLVLVVAAAAGLMVGLDSPAGLTNSATVGRFWTPVVSGVWAPLTTPIVLVAGGVVAVFLCWERFAPSSVHRLVRLDQARTVLTRTDLPGAAVLAAILACVVVLFSTADPSKQVVASSAPFVGPVVLALIGLFYWRQRHAGEPMIEPGALAARPAWGALVVNLALGAALMVALIDVPLFARATVDPNSEVAAALVLVRFLVAVPIGAVIGGALCRSRSRAPVVAATGMAMAAASFVAMASWSATALGDGPSWSDVALVMCGLGFGLAIAPVNVAILGAVRPNVHALASALAVAARTIGMLAGLSALTAIGIHRFYAAQARIGSPLVLCPANPGSCPAYDTATTQALLSELHTIFAGAAVCAAAAGVLALLLLRSSADVQDPATAVRRPTSARVSCQGAAPAAKRGRTTSTGDERRQLLRRRGPCRSPSP